MIAKPILKIGGIALLTLAVSLFAFGAASAALSDGSVTVADPANETVEVDADFSDQADVDLSLTQDGDDVRSETVSGSAGDNETAQMDFTGLASGDFNLSVDASDEANVTVSEPRMVTTRNEALNVTENETVEIGVLFDAETMSSADVEISDSNGDSLNSSTIDFDPVESDGGTGTETLEWEATADGEIDVTVDTDNAYAYDGLYVSTDDGFLPGGGAGFIGGVSGTEIPPWAQAVGGLAVMALVAAGIARYN